MTTPTAVRAREASMAAVRAANETVRQYVLARHKTRAAQTKESAK